MEKLLDLLNQYEESMIEKDLEEEEDWIVEYGKVRKEYKWHLRFNNANPVQFPDEMFDYYAISKEYWFIRYLINRRIVNYWIEDGLLSYLAKLENPIAKLITLINN